MREDEANFLIGFGMFGTGALCYWQPGDGMMALGCALVGGFYVVRAIWRKNRPR